jgi:hypothetical protein
MVGNLAGVAGGGMHNHDDQATINLVNTIVWNNQDSTGVGTGTSSASGFVANVTPSFSLMQGYGLNSNGNLDGTLASNAPRFVAPLSPSLAPMSGGDYRMFVGSPAHDAGNNSALPLDTGDLDADGIISETIPFDLANNTRILSGTVDMGAYEGEAISLAILKNNATDLELNWGLLTGCTNHVYESTQPYQQPPLGTPYSETGFMNGFYVGKLGNSAVNYYYYFLPSDVNCPYLLSNHVGEFDFAIVPGTP